MPEGSKIAFGVHVFVWEPVSHKNEEFDDVALKLRSEYNRLLCRMKVRWLP